MKKQLIILFTFFCCGVSLAQKSKNLPMMQAPVLKSKDVPKKFIDRSLLIKKNGLYYNKKGDSLFTGNCTEYWPNKNVKAIYTYKNGKLDGGVARYDDKGRLAAEESYKNGKPFGVWTNSPAQ